MTQLLENTDASIKARNERIKRDKERRKKDNFDHALIIWFKLTEAEQGRICLAMFPAHILREYPLSIMSKEDRDEVFAHLMKFAGDLV